MYKIYKIVALASMLLWACSPLRATESPDQLVAKLRAILPERPTMVTADQVKIMEDAGSTKRLDAATLLIHALAFNFNPGSNESRALVEMMPAAIVLENHYGSQTIPLLMVEGVSTDKEWLQKRIVVVIRSLDQKEVAKAKEAFCLKESLNPRAKRFGVFLGQGQLDIKLTNPTLEDMEKLREFLEKKKEQEAEPPGQRERRNNH